jgi:hypothetical protein
MPFIVLKDREVVENEELIHITQTVRFGNSLDLGILEIWRVEMGTFAGLWIGKARIPSKSIVKHSHYGMLPFEAWQFAQNQLNEISDGFAARIIYETINYMKNNPVKLFITH